MRIRTLLLLPFLSLCFSVPAIAEDALSYKLVKTVVLGSPERWDYLVYDDASHRVFIAHGDHLSVVDGRSGAVMRNALKPFGSHS